MYDMDANEGETMSIEITLPPMDEREELRYMSTAILLTVKGIRLTDKGTDLVKAIRADRTEFFKVLDELSKPNEFGIQELEPDDVADIKCYLFPDEFSQLVVKAE